MTQHFLFNTKLEQTKSAETIMCEDIYKHRQMLLRGHHWSRLGKGNHIIFLWKVWELEDTYIWFVYVSVCLSHQRLKLSKHMFDDKDVYIHICMYIYIYICIIQFVKIKRKKKKKKRTDNSIPKKEYERVYKELAPASE